MIGVYFRDFGATILCSFQLVKIEQTAVFANCTLNSSGATLACSRLGNSVSKRFESPNLEQTKEISVRESHAEARSSGGE